MNEKIKITQVKISDLKPAIYNPRKHTDTQLRQIKQSIQAFGIVDPIIANSAKERNNIVIGGHLRLKAMIQLGYKEAPVVYVNIPEIEKERELNIRLNFHRGEFDMDLLADFDNSMLTKIGFDDLELKDIFNLDPEPSIDKVEIEKNYKFAYKLIIAKNIEELQEIETAIQPLIDKGILVKASAN